MERRVRERGSRKTQSKYVYTMLNAISAIGEPAGTTLVAARLVPSRIVGQVLTKEQATVTDRLVVL